MDCEYPPCAPTFPLRSLALFGLTNVAISSDSGIITPSLALVSFLTYFGNPDPALRGAIVSIYQAGGT